MENEIRFASREDFHAWLGENAETGGGMWIRFEKKKPGTLTAEEALEEALCFGWIDGQMKRVDDRFYIKYFARRRADSEWSAKNIALAKRLEASGRMTDLGRKKMNEAKQAGRFQPAPRAAVAEEDIAAFIEKVRPYEPAYTNLLAMSPSVKRTYTAYALDVKSEEAAQKRLAKIVDRLNQNLKPM